ncbi:transforming growth factor beta activator LRRC33 [Halichoeres trimaculatus]|uniref:transforming growth factor beta activator LRRC33 n=1 Tax=Halichoeres trimaculatus TaxID=147232 RepID=UPI003D9E14C8
MQVQRFTPLLLCLSHLWSFPHLVSGHPQHGPCQLIQRSALCSSRRLTSVPGGLPEDTEELQLNYNRIQTLQDDSLLLYPSLHTLSLACNSLEKLHSHTFQHSKQLENLNVANNLLHLGYQESSEALKTLPRLRALDLSVNRLDDEMAAVLLKNLTSLEYLNLSGNLLQRLDETSFQDLHQLRELDLQRNIMFELDGAFDSNPKLQRLNLAFNYLPCLVDFHMSQLVVLNASHNFIEWFTSRPDTNVTFQLETLDLSDNKLLFFPFLPEQSRLKNLYLSHNSLRFYQHLVENDTILNSNSTVEFYNLKKYSKSNVTAQVWEEDLPGVSSVEILDLSANQVEYLPPGFIQNMPSLSRLRMSTNCLQTINLTSERFSGSLYELDVSNNRLSQISADEEALTALSNLTFFNLSLNALGELPCGLFSSLSSLRSVDLSYNSVDICSSENCSENSSACVHWRDVASLRQLYLKGCSLYNIPESAFTGLSLTHLDLSDNPGLTGKGSIQSLSRTLQHLGLGNTQIQDFDFSSFRSLKFLNISENSLTHLPPSLSDLDLRVLDLRDNKLSTIPPAQANTLAPRLHTILLTGNPFNCCQTEWFRTFETINVVRRSDIQCQDLFLRTHRVQYLDRSVCLEEEGESKLWLILLIVPVCLFFLGVSVVFLLSFRPEILHKSIKKRCLKPTSY